MYLLSLRFSLETIEQCQDEGVYRVALLPFPQQLLSEGAQYISSVFESQVYTYSANMSFAITVESVNISQQKRDLINVYKNFNIKIVDVFANQKSFTTICSSADDADNLCSVEVINVLRKAGMTPITSPQLKSRRSVIGKKISNEILSSSEEIKEEILRANDWAANHIESINKFHNLPFLKITFDCINMKETCLKLGLNFRYLRIYAFLIIYSKTNVSRKLNTATAATRLTLA